MQIHIQPLLMASKSLIIVSILALFEQVYSSKDVDLTKGFASVPLNSSNFEIQRPYDVEQNQRYSFKNGVHRLWVFSTDKPHLLDSKTKPRTELRIQVRKTLYLFYSIHIHLDHLLPNNYNSIHPLITRIIMNRDNSITKETKFRNCSTSFCSGSTNSSFHQSKYTQPFSVVLFNRVQISQSKVEVFFFSVQLHEKQPVPQKHEMCFIFGR